MLPLLALDSPTLFFKSIALRLKAQFHQFIHQHYDLFLELTPLSKLTF